MSDKRRLAGTKRELAPGKWRLAVSAGVDSVTGKRRREDATFYGDERAAELELARMLAAVGRHGSTNMTLWEFIESMYLPSIEPPVLRRRTVDGYRDKLERYVLPSSIASVQMNKLTRYMMASWFRGVQEQRPNKQSQRHIYTALSGALTKAVEWDVLQENPLRLAVKPPVADEVCPAVLTVDEANRYLDAFSGHSLEPLVVIGIAAGLRPSETYALDWSDINLDAGLIHVHRGLHQRSKTEVWYEPNKSRDSKRVIALPEWAVDALRPHRGVGNIFGGATPWNIHAEYKRAVTDLRLTPWCPPENLRHTSATIASESGADWDDLAHRFGHTSSKMLKSKYVKRRLLRDQQVAGVIQNIRSGRDDRKAEAQ